MEFSFNLIEKFEGNILKNCRLLTKMAEKNLYAFRLNRDKKDGNGKCFWKNTKETHKKYFSSKVYVICMYKWCTENTHLRNAPR